MEEIRIQQLSPLVLRVLFSSNYLCVSALRGTFFGPSILCYSSLWPGTHLESQQPPGRETEAKVWFLHLNRRLQEQNVPRVGGYRTAAELWKCPVIFPLKLHYWYYKGPEAKYLASYKSVWKFIPSPCWQSCPPFPASYSSFLLLSPISPLPTPV